MSVVVTGAAGFIGRHVVRTLLRRGCAVTGVDRRPWVPAVGESMVVADLADPDEPVDHLFQRSTGVVHLAGRAGVRDRRADVATSRWRDNVIAGERVLEATPRDVMVVVTSSSSVYGGAGSRQRPHACHEDDPLCPLGGYARSKHALEQRCALRAERGGMVGVVRPFTVAGEGQRPDMAISTWIAALRAGRAVELFGSGARRRDVTDVRDVAEGIVRMLDRRVTRTVNLGTGTSHRLDHLLATVARLCAVDPAVAVEPALAEDVAATRADVRRCRELLGFVPATDLPALVSRQLAATPAAGPRAAVVPARRAATTTMTGTITTRSTP
jgi:nucleoside-diphosphate-sugar epimerase